MPFTGRQLKIAKTLLWIAGVLGFTTVILPLLGIWPSLGHFELDGTSWAAMTAGSAILALAAFYMAQAGNGPRKERRANGIRLTAWIIVGGTCACLAYMYYIVSGAVWQGP